MKFQAVQVVQAKSLWAMISAAKADCVDVKGLMVDDLDDERVVPCSDDLLRKAYP